MKHLKVLSTEKPIKAEEVAWIQLKDLVATNIPKVGFVGPTGNMSQEQVRWLATQWDNWLQK
jgi:hypothetical protein